MIYGKEISNACDGRTYSARVRVRETSAFAGVGAIFALNVLLIRYRSRKVLQLPVLRENERPLSFSSHDPAFRKEDEYSRTRLDIYIDVEAHSS